MAMQAFFPTMRTYFSGREKPFEPLLGLKLKKFVVGVLIGGRLNPSAGLLCHWKLNVTKIATESGFEDVSHFRRRACRQIHPGS